MLKLIVKESKLTSTSKERHTNLKYLIQFHFFNKNSCFFSANLTNQETSSPGPEVTSTPQPEQQQPQQESNIQPSPPEENAQAPTSNDTEAGNDTEQDQASGTQQPSSQDAAQQSTQPQEPILDGVDPSFLAALPDDMRDEVIAEQLRLQRLRQRAQANVVEEVAGPVEVNPEFLAALPPAIQEEVLAQQRLEQQRHAAASANPEDPVDAAAFFQNLQPSLRQAVCIKKKN